MLSLSLLNKYGSQKVKREKSLRHSRYIGSMDSCHIIHHFRNWNPHRISFQDSERHV